MKKYRYFILAALLALAVLTMSSIKSSYEPPLVRTGAPGEATCGSAGCHDNMPNSETGSLDLSFSRQHYQPGDTISFALSVHDDTASRFGFELTVLNSDNERAGNIISVSDNSTIRIDDNNNRQYASHRIASENNLWTVQWVAPDSAVGEVSFYAAGNASNNDGEPSGDHIYTDTGTLSAVTATTTYKPRYTALKLYPNPAKNIVKIKMDDLFFSGRVRCNIYDLQGNRMLTQVLKAQLSTINVQHLDEGQYLVALDNGIEVITKKLMK